MQKVMRRFKVGERVQDIKNKKIMYVNKYVLKHDLNDGEVTTGHELECVWYETNQTKREVFDQRKLKRAARDPDFYIDWNPYEKTANMRFA